MNPTASPSLPVMNKVGEVKLAERLAKAIDHIETRRRVKKQNFKNYSEARGKAEDRLSAFRNRLKEAAKAVDAKFVTHIKSRTAFEEKQEAGRTLNDVLRGALIVRKKSKYPEAMHAVQEAFGKIVNVDNVAKPRGPMGYKGALHLDVEIDNFLCEVQILTGKLWKAKLKSYRAYRKQRNGKGGASKEEIARARKLFKKVGLAQVGWLYKEGVDHGTGPVAIAVDLDGTITEPRKRHVDGKFGKIREHAAEIMQKWKDKGYHVIIWTARDDMLQVREWLKENKVPHDELNRYADGPPTTSAKIIATVYVDDRGVNARRDWKYIDSEVEALIAAGPKKIPLPMIGHYEPDSKIKRDAFLYQDPKGDPDKFAQCESCVAFTGKSCAVFPKGNTVSPGGSCGVYRHGKGDPDMLGKETGQFSKTQAGYVERQVRCENCAYFHDEKTHCELFEKLNKQWPHIFDLDKDVNPKGCCDAQTARGEKVKEAMELPPLHSDAGVPRPKMPLPWDDLLVTIRNFQLRKQQNPGQTKTSDYDFVPGAGSGVNIVDRIQDYVRRQQEWDASRIGAQYDRPTYANLMRGLGRLTGVKPPEPFIEKATGDVAAVAPYANQFMPGVWNMIHGPQGSTANLAKNLYASGDVGPRYADYMPGISTAELFKRT